MTFSKFSRRFGLAVAISALGFATLSSTAQAEERRCARARLAAGETKPLPKLQAKVREGEPIRIVALGSSSTEGTPDLPQGAVYPSVLGRALSRELLTPVEVINKGKGGETIPDMVARLERDVLNQKPDLLVWQLGVNDVLAFDGVTGAIETMKRALLRIQSAGVPVLLVDLQVSPMVERDKDGPAMQAAITEAARTENVLHFHRLDVMRDLIATKTASLSDLIQKDELHMTPLAHLCTGTLIAEQIARSGLDTQ